MEICNDVTEAFFIFDIQAKAEFALTTCACGWIFTAALIRPTTKSKTEVTFLSLETSIKVKHRFALGTNL